MKILGREITVNRAGNGSSRGDWAAIVSDSHPASVQKANANLLPLRNSRGWMATVLESFTGAWQQNIEINQDTVLTYSAVFACVTLIASDIGKLRIKFVEQDNDGIWTEVMDSPYAEVLKRPNRYQTRIKFIEQWIVSKLIHGNTYVLKQRNARGVVEAMYVLDPTRVVPLVAPDGSVFYQLKRDDLSGVRGDDVTVPASEIIHDTMVALFHPLVGVSPIYACGLAATQGVRIQTNSAKFFGNNSTPGGILTAPGAIGDDTALRLKQDWQSKYSGDNAGKIAVLGDGLRYEAMAFNARDSQLIEQLKLSAETVCSCFHVPPFKVHIGQMPASANAQMFNQIYYSDCLQSLIENLELMLDDGLGYSSMTDGGKRYGTELDLDGLLRMDPMAMIEAAGEGVKSSVFKPDEARKKLNLSPVPGGNTPYMQQQNYSLAALAQRDATNPLAVQAPIPAPATPNLEPEATAEKEMTAFLEHVRKGLMNA